MRYLVIGLAFMVILLIFDYKKVEEVEETAQRLATVTMVNGYVFGLGDGLSFFEKEKRRPNEKEIRLGIQKQIRKSLADGRLKPNKEATEILEEQWI